MTLPMIAASVFAPAKINLCLHVTGQRADGYHLLDTLVAFANVGDHLHIQIGNTISVTTEGPEANGVPADMDNLVLQVASFFKEMPGASFLLDKRLPVSSGIGGGSADAAAAFRGLMAHWSDGVVDPVLYDADRSPMGRGLLELGADIPMCLQSTTVRAEGIGDVLTPVSIPSLIAVLVNPRVSVATPSVFSALEYKANEALPETLPSFQGPYQLIDWLSEQRNDLQEPACRLFPEIAEALKVLDHTKGCLLSRMSGSGATCFGIYETATQAKNAEKALRDAQPEWWVVSVVLGNQSEHALPRIKRSNTAAFS
ncbi:MAG: 4-(cytidine 5'-diphospho)-2-C-methyl-D-erythritol kinase [Silicimonas sp.]|nr:4-(cytidine 5'-diphospho)-2-C-methyl-D-erythritol kinase [Silicimonas sp.]